MEQYEDQIFRLELLKASGYSKLSWGAEKKSLLSQTNMILTGILECLRLSWRHLLMKGQRRWSHQNPGHSELQRNNGGSPLEAFIWWQSNPPKVSALRGKDMGPAMTSCSTGLLTDCPSVPPRLPLTKPWRISTGIKQTKHSGGYLFFIKRKKMSWLHVICTDWIRKSQRIGKFSCLEGLGPPHVSVGLYWTCRDKFHPSFQWPENP